MDTRKYGSLMKLLRVTCYVRRFIENLKLRVKDKEAGNFYTSKISKIELDESRRLWIVAEQCSLLSNKKRLKDLTIRMGLFKDDFGVYRLKGRLEHSELNEDAKFPIFLEQSSHLTELIIYQCHERVKHCRTKDTLNELRSSYWVPQGRRTVNRVIKNCLICSKAESKPFKELPAAPLPSFRVKGEFPFSATGIDLFGPLMVRNIYNPGKETFKVHGVLFTCASSRAVHLDLVPNTTCIAFVRCLKRFIARYGVSKLFISDNATCFTGPELTNFVQQINSEWTFILEASP